MTIKIEPAALIETIESMLLAGLERDNWFPTTIGNKPLDRDDLLPNFRQLFARERARNIVATLRNEQELNEESDRG